MKSKAGRAVVVTVLLGLGVAACGGSGGDGKPTSTEVLSSNEPPVVQDLNQWALDYTGGKSGAAVGDPIRFGYVNSEDVFSDSTVGLLAAVDYVNEELSGAAGRPLEVVPCAVSTPTDGVTCGAFLAGDSDVVAVVTGAVTAGTVGLYSALDGIKPMIIGNAITSDDMTTSAGKSFTAGSPGIALGTARFVTTQLEAVEHVAVVADGTVVAESTAERFLQPALQSAGIRYSYFGLSSASDSQDIESVLAKVEEEETDVVVLLSTIEQCIKIRDAMDEVGVDVAVVTTAKCAGPEMAEHLQQSKLDGPVPNGWYVVGYGFNYFQPDVASGMDIYVKKVQQYGRPAAGSSFLEYTGFAGPSFANVLTLTRFINQLGADSLDFESLDSAIRNFAGPMMMQAGPLNCDGLTAGEGPQLVAVCASQVGVQQFIDGQWRSVTDGLNGKAIDVSTS